MPSSRLRITQIRLVTRLCLALSRHARLRPALRALSLSPRLERLLVGFRSGFPTRDLALRAIHRVGALTHDSPAAIALHQSFGERPRPSDYPVLFHLSRLLPTLTHIADIGGSVGNLFFCYDPYLHFPPDFRWTVCEIEACVQQGRKLAAERGESRLSFSTELADSEGASLVLISGALQFLQALPPALFGDWPQKPQHVIVNRTPITYGPPLYGVQDSGSWLTAARLINREELLQSMQAAGYQLMDEWSAVELQLHFPLRPQSSVHHYSGFLFSLAS